MTEFSTLMLHEIGLGDHLEEKHFHKYGLTFYFKETLDDPADYTYATHEATRIPPMPSNQVNRFSLDNRLIERAQELNVRLVEGTVKDVSIDQHGVNQITYANTDGDLINLDANWIVDASGRRRFLANKLELKKKSKFQRSTFWFRLQDFDRDILKQIQEVKSHDHCFDSYYVTHHFFGKNNWIWAIPIRPHRDNCDNLISIGIVYRPDLFATDVTSIEDFTSQVATEHPTITKLVQSGKVVDTNAYRNYFYETVKSYSAHGWFIIGDAGDTVDPLYSTGVAMTAIQIKQVAAIIDADSKGTLSEEFVGDLEQLYKSIRDSLQFEISTLYEVMDDSFQSHIRMHFSSAFYFYFLLPAWLSEQITNRVGARFMVKVLEDGAEGFESFKSLLQFASKRLGPLPARDIKNQYDSTVNWELFGKSEKSLPRYLGKFCLFYATTRFYLLRKSGWHDWHKHLPLCLADLLRSFVFGVMLRGRAIKDVRFIKELLARRPVGNRDLDY